MFRKIRSYILAASLAVVALLAGSAKANAQYNRLVDVVNDASAPIYHLYVSNVGTDSWGPDQLGRYETIDADDDQIFNMDDGSGYCMFDLKAVLSDGRVAIRHNFNVCRQSKWTVTD